MQRLPGLAASTVLAAALPAIAQEAGTVTTSEIDPDAYTGTWFEIARTPAPFQEQCEGGVTASYDLVDETTMKVVNRCDLPSGETQGVSGEAEVVDGNFNTFNVQLGGSGDSPGINYVVAAVSEIENGKYQWAAVHSPDGDIGWILSRSTELAPEARARAEAALDEAGVDTSELSDTPQPPDTYDPEAVE